MLQLDLSIETCDGDYLEGTSILGIAEHVAAVKRMLDEMGKPNEAVYLRMNLIKDGDLLKVMGWIPELYVRL